MVLRSTAREDICLSFEWCARELMCVCACEYLCKRIAIRDECVAREALKAEWKARERYALDSQARDSD